MRNLICNFPSIRGWLTSAFTFIRDVSSFDSAVNANRKVNFSLRDLYSSTSSPCITLNTVQTVLFHLISPKYDNKLMVEIKTSNLKITIIYLDGFLSLGQSKILSPCRTAAHIVRRNRPARDYKFHACIEKKKKRKTLVFANREAKFKRVSRLRSLSVMARFQFRDFAVAIYRWREM